MRLSRAETKERNRKALLEAALELVGRDGYRAKLDEIAELAGLTTGAVYSLFGSKDGLFLALMEDYLAPFRGELADMAERGLSLRQVVEGYARLYWKLAHSAQILQHLALETTMTDLALREPSLLKSMAERFLVNHRQLAGLLADRAFGTGQTTTAAQAERLAFALKALLGGLTQTVAYGLDELSEQVFIGSSLALISPEFMSTTS